MTEFSPAPCLQPSYNNPLALNIGQRVRVERTCKLHYHCIGVDHNRKDFDYTDRDMCYMYVVGCVKKATGDYSKAASRGGFLGSDEDYEQARLIVDKYHWLYELKLTINGPTYLAKPEDIREYTPKGSSVGSSA